MRSRLIALLVVVFGTIGIGLGVLRMEISSGYRAFFDSDSTELRQYDELKNIYGNTDNILIVLESNGGNVFSRDSLKILEHLTRECWKISGVTRVESLTNWQRVSVDGDDLVVEDLIQGAESLTDTEIRAVKEFALSDHELVGRLVSPQGDVTGINLLCDVPPGDGEAVGETIEAARDLLDRMGSGNFKSHLIGELVINRSFDDYATKDMALLLPVMAILMAVMMLYFLRWSFWATGAILIVVLGSSLVTVGIAGWLGISINLVSGLAPTMVMTIAVADGIHFFKGVFKFVDEGYDKATAVTHSFAINRKPIVITSLTTCVGFLALNFSESPPFRDLGNLAAFGVIAAMVSSLILLPVFARTLPLRKQSSRPRLPQLVNARARSLAVTYPWVVVSTTSCLVIVCFISAARNRMDDRWIEYFSTSTPIRKAADFTMDRLTGLNALEYSIASRNDGGIVAPDYLNALERFRQWLMQQPEVSRVNSFSEIMRRLNMHLHGDDPNFLTIPATQELAAQYLLLYEMSLPLGLDLRNQLAVNGSATRLTAVLRNPSTSELECLTQRAAHWLAINTPELSVEDPTGLSVMFASMAKKNLSQMVYGYLSAIAIITLSLFLCLRSFRSAAISIATNLLPSILAFGVWGIYVGEIGLSLSVVTVLTLGIIVDDPVHFIIKYSEAKGKFNISTESALEYAFDTAGRGITATSAILASGFLVLLLSNFRMNAWMGMMTTLTIIFAWLIVILFLPALLLLIERHRIRHS